MQNSLWTRRGKERVRQPREQHWNVHTATRDTAGDGELLCDTGTALCSAAPGGVGGGGRLKREQAHVQLRRTHAAEESIAKQTPTQYCKAIILQLKINFLKN